MKYLTFTTLFTLFYLISQAYTWIPFGPDSINASHCRFGIAMGQHVIIASGEIYIYEDDMQWHMYSFNLPVKDAAYLSPTEILVAIGDGSYSDGIYNFNLETHNLELVDWWFNPNFIHYVPVLNKDQNKFIDQYFVGGQFSGMITSIDGINWTELAFFSGKSCSAMDYYENHFVVTEVSNLLNIYYSDDYGVTWNQSAPGSPIITDLKFNNEGTLYGIFPDFSNSSGLYKSIDYGQTWEVEFWSDNMSAVGYDALNNIFVGWESPMIMIEGVAIYKPNTSPPGLTFLNNGLPNLNINKIQLNPTMSAIAIFVCTHSGVYISYDYLVGIEPASHEQHLTLFPNPVNSGKVVQIECESDNIIYNVRCFSQDGALVRNFHPNRTGPQSYQIIAEDIEKGTYYLKIQTKNFQAMEKLLVF